jgi:hypothetical protein
MALEKLRTIAITAIPIKTSEIALVNSPCESNSRTATNECLTMLSG